MIVAQIPGISPFIPWAAVLPLVFIVMVSAIKDAVEDCVCIRSYSLFPSVFSSDSLFLPLSPSLYLGDFLVALSLPPPFFVSRFFFRSLALLPFYLRL